MTLAQIAPLSPVQYTACKISDLPGFEQDTLENAVQAWKNSCHYLLNLAHAPSFPLNVSLDQWQKVARHFLKALPKSFKEYLLSTFEAYEIHSASKDDLPLFTGYFIPQLQGSPLPNDKYSYPIYRRPQNLIVIEDLGLFRASLAGHRIAGFVQNNTLTPCPTRYQIEEGILRGQGLEICWVEDPIELYLMHVQGGGEIIFPNHSSIHLCYDGTNGHAYRSLGQEMIQQGLLTAPSSLAKMKKVLKENISRSLTLFHHNESYVFFKEESQAIAPKGRLGSTLTPLRSLAVDPRAIPLGFPLWVNTVPVTGFMTAQDVGGAIKGTRRGDIFCGTGEQAGLQAGSLNHEGRLFILIPQRNIFS